MAHGDPRVVTVLQGRPVTRFTRRYAGAGSKPRIWYRLLNDIPCSASTSQQITLIHPAV